MKLCIIQSCTTTITTCRGPLLLEKNPGVFNIRKRHSCCLFIFFFKNSERDSSFFWTWIFHLFYIYIKCISYDAPNFEEEYYTCTKWLTTLVMLYWFASNIKINLMLHWFASLDAILVCFYYENYLIWNTTFLKLHLFCYIVCKLGLHYEFCTNTQGFSK